MGRTARCIQCVEEFEVATTTGPLPSKCDTCDPHLARKRRHNTGGRSYGPTLRSRVIELEAEVERLREQARNDKLALSGDRLGSKHEVARAFMAAMNAEGHTVTRDRLLDLADAAQAWARMIATGPGTVERIEGHRDAQHRLGEAA